MGRDGEDPQFPAVRLLGRRWCSLARVGLAWVLLLLAVFSASKNSNYCVSCCYLILGPHRRNFLALPTQASRCPCHFPSVRLLCYPVLNSRWTALGYNSEPQSQAGRVSRPRGQDFLLLLLLFFPQNLTQSCSRGSLDLRQFSAPLSMTVDSVWIQAGYWA